MPVSNRNSGLPSPQKRACKGLSAGEGPWGCLALEQSCADTAAGSLCGKALAGLQLPACSLSQDVLETVQQEVEDAQGCLFCSFK